MAEMSVTITPLQPPFHGEIIELDLGKFNGNRKMTLALSREDFNKIQSLMSTGVIGRAVSLTPLDDGKISVSVVQ